ncbi:hypothetical protein ACS0TY_015029 [Phlomoides rotata]
MKLEDLLMIYDQEKLKFLSSFVGQRVRVGVVLADRNSRKLIVSIKPKEKEEMVEKKRINLSPSSPTSRSMRRRRGPCIALRWCEEDRCFVVLD